MPPLKICPCNTPILWAFFLMIQSTRVSQYSHLNAYRGDAMNGVAMAARGAKSFMIRVSLSPLILTSTWAIFILSCFFILRSTGCHSFPDHRLIHTTKVFSALQEDTLSNGNRLPLEDEDQEESEGEESRVNYEVKCNMRNGKVLKVFMYDLPPEFHFGILNWEAKGNRIWPDLQADIPEYPGGLNLQHSIEYWLTLDLLASEFPRSSRHGSAIRVQNSSEADVIFVPFFSSLSYNKFSKLNKDKNRLLQDKLVRFLTAQEEWKRSGGIDHVVMAHHPNSMMNARTRLWPAMFILADFGRYPQRVANVDKDVIAPYKHLIENYVNDSNGFDNRPTLMYFQGAIYRKDEGLARQELFYLLKDEKDVHFTFGTIKRNGISKASLGMQSSKFCLNIAGDTPSSNRLFDAIASHCVPVIISDQIELPFEDVIDYSEFCIFVPLKDALKEKYLIELFRGIGKAEWTRMWEKLKEVESFFEYRYPSKQGDAVQMIWQNIVRKVPAIKAMMHKSRRYSHFGEFSNGGLKSASLPSNFW